MPAEIMVEDEKAHGRTMNDEGWRTNAGGVSEFKRRDADREWRIHAILVRPGAALRFESAIILLKSGLYSSASNENDATPMVAR